jgi:hypothetical protein
MHDANERADLIAYLQKMGKQPRIKPAMVP